jgi:hypothetical protein
MPEYIEDMKNQIITHQTERGQMPDKAASPLEWVQEINAITQTAKEIAIKELIEGSL